jgi:hypothetical protein
MPHVKKKSFIQKNGLIAVWAMAGFIALGYIGFLVTGADQYASGVKMAGAGGGHVGRQVAALKANVDSLNKKEAKLARKLSNLEQSLGPVTASLPAEPTGYGIDEVTSPSISPQAVMASKEKAATMLMRANNGSVSIKIAPLAQEEDIAELLGPTRFDAYGLQLARASSTEALKRHWDYLQKSHGDILKGLKARYENAGGPDKPLYKLVAGPIEHLSDARSICARLSREAVDCSETSFKASTRAALKTAGNP